MLRLLLQRLCLLVPILVIISLASFGLAELSPSDPAEVAIRVNAMVPTPELIAATRHEFGLDQPFLVRWGSWVLGVLHGDFGKSWVSGLPIADEMWLALPPTLYLAVTTLAIIVLVSLGSGFLCARYEGKWIDTTIRGVIFVLSSMPAFWAGLLLMWLFAVQLDLLPTSGMRSADSIILPAATLSLAYIGAYMRLIRAEMVRAAHADWVLFARGRGLSELRITAHLLLNSLSSSAAALGMSIPKLAAGAFVVESIFAWPGLGRLCLSAIFNRDLPVVEAYILFMSVLFVLFNLASDLVAAWLDPRERYSLGANI